MKYLICMLGPLLLMACKNSTRNSEEKKKYTSEVTQFATDASSIFTNAYIIELDESIVVIDATLTVSSSKDLRAQVDKIGKPLAGVFITHGHPDHYNGLGYLIDGLSTKVYSTRDVHEVIIEFDNEKEEQWVPMFGPEWPRNRIFPNTILDSDEHVLIDGVKFTITAIGPGESHSDTYITMQNGTKKVAFVGDVVLHNVHAYMTDGHADEWLDNIGQLQNDLKEYDKIYPGHGNPGGLELLTWQENYLTEYIKEVKKLLGPNGVLNDKDKNTLTEKMKPLIPDDKLIFLVSLGADSVVQQILDEKL